MRRQQSVVLGIMANSSSGSGHEWANTGLQMLTTVVVPGLVKADALSILITVCHLRKYEDSDPTQ